MESTQISALEGNKLAGQLHIIFRAKIVKCPSETQDKYVTESKVERPPEKQASEAAKEFVNQTLMDDGTSVSWALESIHIIALQGDKIAGQLTILFDAKIGKCPTETQKKTRRPGKLAMKGSDDNCKHIDFEGYHPCSLHYSKLSRSSSFTCTMIKVPES
ncbi:hypothetical protein M514_15631 [Trichuris suis]|uniref:Uncharacterized protein n=1 Tax=Trichuris suis TaxID=68888 RepID=A0A085NSB2_9BILA|nr:hypothetical protein M514_15631 [Trichuris suis]